MDGRYWRGPTLLELEAWSRNQADGGWGLMGRNRGPRGRVSGHNHGGALAGENKVLGERKSRNRRTECEGLHAWMTTNNGWGSGGWRGLPERVLC